MITEDEAAKVQAQVDAGAPTWPRSFQGLLTMENQHGHQERGIVW